MHSFLSYSEKPSVFTISPLGRIHIISAEFFMASAFPSSRLIQKSEVESASARSEFSHTTVTERNVSEGYSVLLDMIWLYLTPSFMIYLS